jgi:hypothetical protein
VLEADKATMMWKRVCTLTVSLVVLPLSVTAQQQKQIPIVVEAHTVSDTLKKQRAITASHFNSQRSLASVMSDPIEVIIK